MILGIGFLLFMVWVVADPHLKGRGVQRGLHFLGIILWIILIPSCFMLID